jgi:integrase/recombinase XerD
MTPPRLCLPVKQWPEIDQARWLMAQKPAGFLEDDKPATHWSPKRRRIVEHGYGSWLSFLDRNGALDPSCTPGDRATEHRLRDFVAELRARVAPASVLMMVGGLLRMLVVLVPERDWSMLARVYSHFRRTVVPSRDKRAHMVAATDLLALGISLMEAWEAGPPQRINKASRYRDGLLIALLIACPLRIRNLASIEIGRHLVGDGRGYQLHFTAAETKTKRPYVASLPPELTPYIDGWLQVHAWFSNRLE